jgi:CRISPR-associated endonuclease Csn1
MKNQKNLDYFVGFDIGTNSIGYAVSDTSYDLIKYQQHPIWGVHLFETAGLAEERRTHRAARRRLDRRQQRVQLLRELFSMEIGKVDRNFFKRIDSSSLKRNDAESHFAIFADREYTDADFYKQYPTIHHLILELIDSNSPHDVRLVYLACAWLVVHRGHFFSEVAKHLTK